MNTKNALKRGILLLCTVLNLVTLLSPLQAQVYTIQSANLPTVGASNQTVDIATADLDGDGDPDLVLANEFQVNGVLLNNGNGSFSNGMGVLPPIVHDSDDLVIADFDQDDDPDILLVSEGLLKGRFYPFQKELLLSLAT